ERGVPYPWKGVATTWEPSDITGTRVARYSNTPWDTTVTLYRETVPQLAVTLPAGGYIVPQEFADGLERLALHGIRSRKLARAWSDTVEMTRVTAHTNGPKPYEGRLPVRVTGVQSERRYRTFRAGDVWVPCDQRGGALAANLLEAQAPDGFMAWGFFL